MSRHIKEGLFLIGVFTVIAGIVFFSNRYADKEVIDNGIAEYREENITSNVDLEDEGILYLEGKPLVGTKHITSLLDRKELVEKGTVDGYYDWLISSTEMGLDKCYDIIDTFRISSRDTPLGYALNIVKYFDGQEVKTDYVRGNLVISDNKVTSRINAIDLTVVDKVHVVQVPFTKVPEEFVKVAETKNVGGTVALVFHQSHVACEDAFKINS